jgi:hypothetical protein
MHRVPILCFVALLFVPNGAWAQGPSWSPVGHPFGPQFRINTFTPNRQRDSSVATDSSGNFVVVWRSSDHDGSGYGVVGQRYASAGAPLGSEFRVNTYTTNAQINPAVASDSSGNFIVVWTSDDQDGSNDGVFGQRYASSGTPLGPEFRVNSFTLSIQGDPAVASDSSGNFVLAWNSNGFIFGQRYANTGAPLGPEFLVSPSGHSEPSVASDSSGNFVVV